jgi:SAM-dependent methyltransferase
LFRDLSWQHDRMRLGDLVFRLQHYASNDWELGDECFIFYKIKELVDQYAAFFSRRPSFRPQNVLELGLWDGGSLAFWFEQFQPRKHVGIDIERKTDSAYFRRYVKDRGLQARIRTCWGVDQADTAALQQIVGTEFNGALDLVIDDASHVYGPTKISFECLFPMLRPGGLYIIEDWAWEHWQGCSSPAGGSSQRDGLTRLVRELIEATGTPTGLIDCVTVYQGFAVVERGGSSLEAPSHFSLEDHIFRQPSLPAARRASASLRRFIRRRLDTLLASRFSKRDET